MAEEVATLKYVEGLDDLADEEKVIFNIGLDYNCGEEAQKVLANNGLESGSGINQWMLRREIANNSDLGRYEIFSPMMEVKDAKKIMPKLIADLDKAKISSGLVVPMKARDLFGKQAQSSVQKTLTSEELIKLVGGPVIKKREERGAIFDKQATMERIGLKSEQEIPEFFNSLEDLKKKYPKEQFLFSGTTASDDYPLVSARAGRNGTVYATPHIDYAAKYDGITNVGFGEGFTATGDRYTTSVVGKIGNQEVKIGFINIYEQSSADKYFPNFGMEGYRKQARDPSLVKTFDVYEGRDGYRFADAHKQAQTDVAGLLTREQAIEGYIGRGLPFEKDGKVYMPLSFNAETYVTPEKNPLKTKIMHVVYGEYPLDYEFFMPVPDEPNETIQKILDNREIKIEDTFSHNRRSDVLNRFQKQKEEFMKQSGVDLSKSEALKAEVNIAKAGKAVKERLIVPDFANIGEFKRWVGNLDERAIQKWTAADWVTMYHKIDGFRSFFGNGTKMVEECMDEFIKLYSNYRFEPEQLKYIKEIAHQAGEELAKQNIDAAKLSIPIHSRPPLYVPKFGNIEEFKSWVGQLNGNAIKLWMEDDWSRVLMEIDNLRTTGNINSSLQKAGVFDDVMQEIMQKNGSNISREMVFDHVCREEMSKLFANSSLEAQKLNTLKEIYSLPNEADRLNGFRKHMFLDRNASVQSMLEKVDDITARSTEYLPEQRLHTLGMIDENLGNGIHGTAYMKNEKGSAVIKMNTATAITDGTIGTAAHEAAHVHFQVGNAAQVELLQKGVIPHPKLGKDFAALMMYNLEFYLSIDDINDYCIKQGGVEFKRYNELFEGYKNEATEKLSQLYGKEMDRAYRHASGQISERTALKVCHYIGKSPEVVKYTDKGIEMIYRAWLDEDLSGEKLMKNLKSKLGSSISEELDLKLLDKTGRDVKITVPQNYGFTQKFEKYIRSLPEVEAVVGFIGKEPLSVQYTDTEMKLRFYKSAITTKEEDLIQEMVNIGKKTVECNEVRGSFKEVIVPRDKEFFAKLEQAGKTGKLVANTAAHGGAKSGGGIIGKIDNKVNKAIDTFVEKGGAALNNSKVGKAYASAKKKIADSTVVKKTKEIATQTKDAVVKTAKKVNQSAPVKAVKSAVKSTGKAIARTAPAKAVKQTGKAIAKSAAGQAVKKAVAKTVANTTVKAVGKSLLKKIPVISIGAGLIFGAQRALAGDFVGAAGEVTSGVCGTFPGVGTAASVAIDASLAGRDIYKELNAPQDKTKVQVKADAEKAHKYEQQKQRQLSLTSAKTKDKTAQKQATDSKMKTNAANANKYQKQMEDLLNKMNKANGKDKVVDVKKTIATLYQKYGDNAYALLQEAVQRPGKYADAVKDTNIKTSRNAVQHLCDGKVNQQMVQKILHSHEK